MDKIIYLEQANYLDQKINSHLREKEALMAMKYDLSSPTMTPDKVQISFSGEAPYVRIIDKICMMEERIVKEIDLLVDLKAQIHEVIETVSDTGKQAVLIDRYLNSMTWEEIGDEIGKSVKTAKRWHDQAVEDLVMPADPIVV